jgi:hypothetical protein
MADKTREMDSSGKINNDDEWGETKMAIELVWSCGKGDGGDDNKDKWQRCNGKCGNDDSNGKKGYELVVTMKKNLSLTFYHWQSRFIV